MRRFRRAIVAVLALALVAGAIYAIVAVLQRSETLVTERCLAVAGTENHELATDQAANASLITAISVRRGLPPRAATIALATAMQESRLRNINYGDDAGPDSRGLFQQRPSQGWGTEEQVMDPVYAANAFFDGLVKVPGYESMEITQAAQAVQRSAFPRAYAQHEGMGRAFASALTGHSEAALNCELRMPEAAGDPAVVVDELTTAFGTQAATVQGRSVQLDINGTQAWAVAHWAVANAKTLSITQVDVDGQTWNREKRDGWQASAAETGGVTLTVSAPAT
ncbi:hypothetical protein [Paenarthrobacter aurescens]|uniref:Heavy metal transporter n=1 Tax=Paenarthrobacter aurescens TaxID=43663 RepID=A0A4Y3NNX3_PAEAU|nr:hypothetical protein [Paenarthrobacter aurescens]MDO6144210.1 hypothetical protein [Paenarthrobacter aurescens]MDO6148057.1 hypothetical protein [Paenarthrobacter aurescens]MDO6159301.1 hypothetical protein [Paenarthrobacter aurescens]MDO6163284.1 hypothetical protein [Paenarthrobacter aurescens]GEB20651.1 hypothetical protein AAU01_34060 [Paenarthrobacter aurescens]